MKTTYQMRRGFTLVELLVVIVIIAALAGLTAPMVIRQRKKADQTEAVNNARQIGLALLEFETEYARFPDSKSGAEVTLATGVAVKAGTTSNALFTQLFAAGITQSEAMFYCKAAYTKKPDGNVTTTTLTLDKGECGFGYITNGVDGFSTSGNPGRPVVAAPFTKIPGTTFDPDFYDGKAVILKIDNSVTSVPIAKATGAVALNGADILATTAGALFEGTTPGWALPDPK